MAPTILTEREIVDRPLTELRGYARNARTHSKTQIRQIADSIASFGFNNPVLISPDGEIIAGHGRVEAARLLGMRTVPTLVLAHLSEAQRRAYVIADNKIALNAGWNIELLASEVEAALTAGIDSAALGFETAELDRLLEDAKALLDGSTPARLDAVPALAGKAVSRLSDVWTLGQHRLVCGDAKDLAAYDALLGAEVAQIMVTDPPYNVPITGHVSGLGKHRHREFAEGSGEMSRDAFVAFLTATLGAAAARLKDGAIAYVCMDWRHMHELCIAGEAVFTELKNLVVWNKTNGGMGTFYRSKHELIFVFKKGSAAHTNSFGLGETGRYRTNVWDYPGASALGPERDAALAMHPTVKPVALIADALKDCSKRGEIVLDPFGGSGSTLIAAETTGRRARLIELDPLYCDTTVRRWQDATGGTALRADGAAFDVLASEVAR